MSVNELAQEIRASVEQRIQQAGGADEKSRLDIEADERWQALLQIRCHELWAAEGRPQLLDPRRYLHEVQHEAMYTKEGKTYRIDGTVNTKEALGFLKDWGTSLVQLNSAAIGAIGLFVGFGDFARSSFLGIGQLQGRMKCIAFIEMGLIAVAAAAFFVSLFFGLMLLNALPGAAQRVPVDAAAIQNDVFAIANASNHQTINRKSWWLRYSFLFGAGVFALSVLLGLLRAALTPDPGLIGV